MSKTFDIREWMFRYRSYTPIPFLILMALLARPTATSMVVGFLVLLTGELLRFWGVSIAGAETRTTGTVGGTYLITTGPFAHIRNPLYVGNMLLYLGVGIMSMALVPWLPLAALAWFYLQYCLIVTREEEYLAQQFGEQYEEYRREVNRFLPRLTPYRSKQPPPKPVNISEGLASERRTLQAIALVIVVLMILFFVRQ